MGESARGGPQHGRHGGHAPGCDGARACGITDSHLHHWRRHPIHPSQLACCEVCSAGETCSFVPLAVCSCFKHDIRQTSCIWYTDFPASRIV
jgi:hypothetical protein